ncbi:hypothetical protein [Segatella bryantii]|jgi:hypothetical protein|uniref:hypothetical protein n=1 Tax=Segatella bryantii TaxID=77095 RepID=UPI00242EA06D|nr:hypothetical protein [Segatella bryantii]
MFQFEFSLEEVQEKLEGMSLKEKIDALEGLENDFEDIKYNVEEACANVASAKEDLIDEYINTITSKFTEEIKTLISEENFEKSVEVRDQKCIVNYDERNSKICLYLSDFDFDNKCSINVLFFNEKEIIKYDYIDEALSKLAEKVAITYKKRSSSFKIETSIKEVSSKMIEIIKNIL